MLEDLYIENQNKLLSEYSPQWICISGFVYIRWFSSMFEAEEMFVQNEEESFEIWPIPGDASSSFLHQNEKFGIFEIRTGQLNHNEAEINAKESYV